MVTGKLPRGGATIIGRQLMAMTNDSGETFGAWLLAQTDREGWVGDLVKAAKSDRQFPRTGSPEEVRTRLRETMAEGDMFEAVDDAESDWMSC